jgi:hypothetical protein
MNNKNVSKISHFDVVKRYGESILNIKINNRYNYIENDKTLTYLGKLVDIRILHEDSNDEKYLMTYIIYFENMSKARYVMKELVYIGSVIRLPIIKVDKIQNNTISYDKVRSRL